MIRMGRIVSVPSLATGMAVVTLLAGAAAAAEDAAGEEDGGLAVLYRQIQLLQDDVRRLQGSVEEQNHRIEQLTREQRERYIELDRRMLELRPNALGAPPADGAAAATVPGTAVAAPPAMPERFAYNEAFATMRNARGLPTDERVPMYENALEMFKALIAAHPNGEFTPNAFYWIGEIHSALDRHELARQAFVQVVNLYADHPKAADALYKLGLTYHRLGDSTRAGEYLDRVIRDYPQSSAAEFAEQFKAEQP